MANFILIAAVAATRVGLYPISLPAGEGGLEQRLAAQLHEGAATLPGVKAFDLVPRSSCLPDEGPCLAAAAAHAGLDQMISAAVVATPRGYGFHLRLFDQGRLREELREQVQGGPLDLAAALEHGVCRVLGAAPCIGELRVGSGEDVAGSHLFVDGLDRGPLPLGPLQLPVGRHLVRAGASEQRVRISYGRETRLRSEARAGGPELLEDAMSADARPPAVPAGEVRGARPAASSAPVPERAFASAGAPFAPTSADASVAGRSRAARILVGAGAALLVASAGAALYSRVESASLDGRNQSLPMTDAEAARSRNVRRAGIFATALMATGAGAIAAGGVVLAISPGGVSLVGGF